MNRLSRTFIAATLLVWPASLSAAIDWCNLRRIVPNYTRNFETVARDIAAVTGCAPQPSDSAHEATWRCPGEPTETFVSLARDPEQGTVLVVIYPPSDSLAMIRNCRLERSEVKSFDPGSFVRRDPLSLGYDEEIFLLNAGPNDPSVLIAGSRTAVARAVASFERGSYGIAHRPYPTTSVRIAGVDIIRSSLAVLLEALRTRGSSLSTSAGENTLVADYRLTAPVGLPGVTAIKVEGVLDHILSVTYEVPVLADYERYIGVLDGEYGRSTRRPPNEGCTSRWWWSGDVAIRGNYCPSGNSIMFLNRVVSQQFLAFDERERARQASTPDTPRPTIDPDNY